MSDWYAQYVNGTVTRLVPRGEAEQTVRRPGVTGSLDTALEFTDHDPRALHHQRHFRIVPITDHQAASWRQNRRLGPPEGEPCSDV